MMRKKKINPTTYQAKHPEKLTSYDTSQPETDTPQEIRESEEPTAQMMRKGSASPKDGGSKQPG